jgi:hypothetical protein
MREPLLRSEVPGIPCRCGKVRDVYDLGDRLAIVASDRISAQGFGSTRSVTDNASPEGRAENRRVEIVVQPAAPATP